MSTPSNSRTESPHDYLESLARKIVRLRLETPVLFFLELHKPLTTLAHTSCLMFQPIATPVFGAERVKNWERILSSPEHIEEFCKLIEHFSNAQSRNSLINVQQEAS